MKNQYFGDINDYRKYGILRALQAGSGLPLAVCWMLTPDDGGPDGRRVDYLHSPNRWRHLDPEVFDELRAALLEGRRTIHIAERTFLSTALSHPEVLSHEAGARRAYFDRLVKSLRESSIVFFDPDNGIEVRSTPIGTSGAEKYVYWQELETLYQRGHDCLVYQHFPRKPRERFTREIAREAGVRLGAPWVATVSTSHVLFILAPQSTHGDTLTQGLREVRRRWASEVEILLHRPVRGTT